MDDFAILRHGGIRECSVVFEHKKIPKKKKRSKGAGILDFPKVI